MSENSKQQVPRPLAELNLMDDFLFTEMMNQKDIGVKFSRIILETIFGEKFNLVSVVPQRTFLGMETGKHGIRLDAFIEAVPEKAGLRATVYDVEPENKEREKSQLPRRSRYYTDSIDVHLLDTGEAYENLPDMVSIMILSFDPFGAGDMYYEAGTKLFTHPETDYNDGVRRIFLYTKGNLNDKELEKYISGDGRQLQNMLRYFQDSREANVVDASTSMLHEMTIDVKSRKEVNKHYMKSWEWERSIREEGEERKVIEQTLRKTAKGKSSEQIAEDLEENISYIAPICRIIQELGAEADVDSVYAALHKNDSEVSA